MPSIVSTGSSNLVPGEINDLQTIAANAIEEARSALSDLAWNTGSLPDSTASPGQSTGNILYNKTGSTPVWDGLNDFPVFSATPPTLKSINNKVVEDFTGEPPPSATVNIPVIPNVVMPQSPGDAPLVTDIAMPEPPEARTIADPNEYAITIPSAPTIVIEDFTGTPPVNNITKPDGSFNWQEDPYTSDTLDKIIYNVDAYLGGGVGMPDAAWELIWAKDNDRENRAGVTLRSQINKEMSDKGFQIPQGIQLARTDKVNQDIFNGSQSRSRDIAIKESELAIENLRFAITQGIALEQLRGSWYQAGLTRMLESTKYAADLAITLFNAEVAFYNSQVQMYLAEMQVWEAELKGELSKLEVYKSELEAQRLIGTLNQQEIDKYLAKQKSIQLDIDLYNSTLQGLKLTLENDSIKIDAHSKNVQSYATEIQAVNATYNGYQTAMQGAKIETDIQGLNAKIFSDTVDAYAKKTNVEIDKSELDIAINTQRLQEYDQLLKGFVTKMDAKIDELNGRNIGHQANLNEFNSNLNSDKVALSAQVQSRSADAQNAAQVTQTNIQNARTNADNAKAEMGASIGIYRAISEAESGYAAAALSAMNISAGMDDTASTLSEA